VVVFNKGVLKWLPLSKGVVYMFVV